MRNFMYDRSLDMSDACHAKAIEAYAHSFHRLFRDGLVDPQHSDVVLIGSCAGSVAA